jgi:hypothetical protein
VVVILTYTFSGYIELQDGLPGKWEMLQLAQRFHEDYNERVIELLEEHKYDGVEQQPDGGSKYSYGSEWTGGWGGRPGYLAAEKTTAKLQKDGIGIHVTATHPSISDDTWGESGSTFVPCH